LETISKDFIHPRIHERANPLAGLPEALEGLKADRLPFRPPGRSRSHHHHPNTQRSRFRL